ncbi:hypothetical protein ACHMXB_06525 [Arthrobacter sp. UC242_113]|uniref:hypothetical protein n=1 Tax=Arthrobacter sp. UC242_113 TaxID=3374550 RepID=UPI0037572D63
MAERAELAGEPSERLQAVKPLAWIMAGLCAVLFFGLVDLSTLFDLADPSYQWAVPLEASWGSLFTFVLAGAYVWIAVVPGQSWPAVVQLGIAGTGLVASSVAGLDGRPLLLGLPVVGSAALFAWLCRELSGPLPRRISVHWPLLVLGAGGAPLWLMYSLYALEKSRTPHEGPEWEGQTMGIDHWPVQGAAGLTLAACSLVMALWPAARPLMRLSVSLSATFIGVAMLAYPAKDGAMPGTGWGIAFAIWGTLLALPAVGQAAEAGSARTARRTGAP